LVDQSQSAEDSFKDSSKGDLMKINRPCKGHRIKYASPHLRGYKEGLDKTPYYAPSLRAIREQDKHYQIEGDRRYYYKFEAKAIVINLSPIIH
jgi:hypothetical protein